MSDLTLPRGVRNNNPGNLCYEPQIDWIGQLGLEEVPPGADYAPRFGRYDTAEHGIRALYQNLCAYQDTHGLRTVRQMINRWAPPADDNDTSDYVRDVAMWMGVRPDQQISIHDPATGEAMVTAIIRQECAGYVYPVDTVLSAIQT